MVGLTLIEVKVTDVLMEKMAFILDGPNYHYVDQFNGVLHSVDLYHQAWRSELQNGGSIIISLVMVGSIACQQNFHSCKHVVPSDH